MCEREKYLISLENPSDDELNEWLKLRYNRLYTSRKKYKGKRGSWATVSISRKDNSVYVYIRFSKKSNSDTDKVFVTENKALKWLAQRGINTNKFIDELC